MSRPLPSHGEQLTERELQVLRLLANGHKNPAIGRTLYIEVNTVKNHVRRLLSKLGARDRANAVHIAHQKGILP